MRETLAHPVEKRLVSKVVDEVTQAIGRGHWRSGDKLPSEREFAISLKVSRNTVTAAYGELERQGVIRRLWGKGAFICALRVSGESFSWSGKVSALANSLDEPVLEMLAQGIGASEIRYPLSAGTPSLEVFPQEIYRESIGRVMAQSLPQALAVSHSEGQWSLRQAIADWSGVDPHHVMIVAGAQEAIDLVARCLIEPGDPVVIDSPTYPGALQSFRSAGAQLLPWGTDWSLSQLEELFIRYRPKLLFTMPTFHNPTGRVMTLKTRVGVLDLACRYRIPVVEDDVYGKTHFGSHQMPECLYKLDIHSQILYMSTFSKMLAPGLRVGWVIAPPYMIKQLALVKMRSNLFTEGLTQLALADLVRSGEMDRHLVRLREHHALLCAAAVQALQPAIDQGLIRCRVPSGSLYLWCRILLPFDADLLFSTLEANGLSVGPGLAFQPDHSGQGPPCFRICFTAAPMSVVVAGIQLLARLLGQTFARNAKHAGEVADMTFRRMQRTSMQEAI